MADRASSRGRTAFDITHAGVFHFVYELPFATNSRGIAGILFKGWQTNGILTLRSGLPFSALVPAADLNTGNDGSPVRPDRLAYGRLDNGNRQLWFDPSAFQRVTCNNPARLDLCHFGNAGRNILASPGQRSLDGSAFNTPWFGQPTTWASSTRRP